MSASLLNKCGLSLHWKKIEKLLSDNPTFAARRKKDKKWQFTITAPGREQISIGNNPILFVNPVKAVQAVLTLHDFFATLAVSESATHISISRLCSTLRHALLRTPYGC
jgi:hypothetical protein